MVRDAEELVRAYSEPHLKSARPCPFCGDENLGVFQGPETRISHTKTWYVMCARCVCRGPIGASPERAVAAWNGDFEPVRRRDLGR